MVAAILERRAAKRAIVCFDFELRRVREYDFFEEGGPTDFLFAVALLSAVITGIMNFICLVLEGDIIFTAAL